MNKLWLAVALAGALFVGACCWRRTTPDPLPHSSDPAIEIIGEAVNAREKAAKETPKDSFDIDKIASNPWVIAGVFLLVQWFEIWYFNRTGRKSATIDAAEAAMQPKLGIIQRVLYWVWRRVYFWKRPDQKDPDKEEEEKKK